MKIINPNYVEPVEAIAETLGQKIAAYMANNPGKREITREELETVFPEHKSDLTHAMLDYVSGKKNWKRHQ